MTSSAHDANDGTTDRSPSTTRPQTELDRIAEAWDAEVVALIPEHRVERGLDGDKTEHSDYSPAHFDRWREAVAAALGRVRDAPVADDVDRVTKLELERVLGLEIDSLDAGEGYHDLNNIASPAQGIRMTFDLMPQSSEADHVDVAGRLAGVPQAIEGYIETLREGIRRGTTPAVRQVREVIAQSRDYAVADGFFTRLATSEAASTLPETLRTDLERGAVDARAAYTRLADFLEQELAPVAREQDAAGREQYSLASRRFLGATVDLDETYEWGLEELARMTAEQEAIADEILPGASVREAIAHLDADPTRVLHSTDELREWMQAKSDAAIAGLADAHFDIPAPMRTLECMIAPTQEGAIYYTGPSEDFSRPGRMWWSVTPGVSEFGTWRELTTVYHEGVPGHHLQVAHATYIRDRLNSWRRNNWTSGHGEGWALYAERLMERLGYLEDPADRLGMLDGQRMRAARVVLDLGVHLGKPVPQAGRPGPEGGRVWDYDYALDFMRDNVNMNDGFVRFEVNRYFGWPGQAPAYKIGQRVWEELRADAEAREGESFDIKAWHTRALDLGGVGLDTLREVLSA